uniref:hypothetical protein n=1 Tax=Belnapia mucosa TaxID=2804532 RepID=UPI0038B41799
MAITTAFTLRAVFRLALRQTEGLIASIIGLLGAGPGRARPQYDEPPSRDIGGATPMPWA